MNCISARTVRTGARLAAGAASLLLLAAVVAPRAAAAEEAENECTDEAWADYNTCLVVSSKSEFRMRLCDLDFVADLIACAAKLRNGT